MSIEIILNLVGCLFLLVFAVQAFAEVKTHRGFSTKAILQMAKVSLSGVKVFLLIGGVIGLISVIFQPLLLDWIPPLPPLFVIGISLLALSGTCLPPTFLFLAASQESGFSLASEFSATVAPLKMVHLLDTFDAGALVATSLNHSDYRVVNDWQRTVRKLSNISPVIIVDIRKLTPNVCRELAHLAEAKLHNKTFLVAESAQAPAEVSRLCNQSGVRFYVVTPQLLELALNRIGWIVLLQPVNNLSSFLEQRMLKIAQAYSM